MTDPTKPATDGSRFLLSLVFRYPHLVTRIAALTLLGTLVSAPVPYLGKIIIDDIIFRQIGATDHGAANAVFGVPIAVWMLAGIVLVGVSLKLLSVAIEGWRVHYSLQISRNVLNDLRLDMGVRLMGAPQRFYESFEPGRIAARITNDVFQMDAAITGILNNIAPSIVAIVVVVGLMLLINPMLTAIVMIAMPLTVFLTVLSYRHLRAFSKEESDRAATLNSTSSEIFGAMRVVRAFTSEAYFLERLRQRCEAVRFEGIRHWTIQHLVSALLRFLSGVGADIFLFAGGIMAIYGHITFGEFFAFFSYQSLLWGPVTNLFNAGAVMQTGAGHAAKVQEILNVDQEAWLAHANLDSKDKPPFQGHIEAKDLSFSYTNEDPVLRSINLRLQPGTMTALVGQSGSGKTTFASLLMGLYLPTSGKLLIDDVDIRQWNLRQLRHHIGVVLQEATLFNGSLRENLCLGQPFTDKELWAALAAAHLDTTIQQLPGGLDAPVGIGGAKLSGGQRQRIAIARVFLRNPSFIILDEATSALDSETEKAIQHSFDALLANRTSVVIAHRLSTIYRADQIVVMHQGRIAEIGNHDDLIGRTGSLYRQLYETQMEGMVPMSGPHRRRIR